MRLWIGLAMVLSIGCGGSATTTSGGSTTGAAGGTGGSGGGMVCAPGKQVSCACPDGFQGAQACKVDGTGYGPCYCGGTTSSAGGTGGTGGTGGAASGGSGGSTTTTGGSGGSGGTGSAGGTTTSTGSGTTTTTTASDCPHQCILDNPAAYTVYRGYGLQSCGCAGMAPCAADCVAECKAQAADENSPCGMCLTGEFDKGQGSACNTTTGTKCISDDTCSPFITCILACP